MDQEKLSRWLASLPDGLYYWTLKKVKRIRSPQANRYYFGVVVKIIADEMGERNKDNVHEILKAMHLPGVLGLPEIDMNVNRFTPVEKLIAISEYKKKLSTADLESDLFWEYINVTKDWAFDFFNGLIIPDPNSVEGTGFGDNSLITGE